MAAVVRADGELRALDSISNNHLGGIEYPHSDNSGSTQQAVEYTSR